MNSLPASFDWDVARFNFSTLLHPRSRCTAAHSLYQAPNPTISPPVARRVSSVAVCLAIRASSGTKSLTQNDVTRQQPGSAGLVCRGLEMRVLLLDFAW